MPILGQKYRHIDMSGLLIGHNRTAKVRIYLLIINIFRKKVENLGAYRENDQCCMFFLNEK